MLWEVFPAHVKANFRTTHRSRWNPRANDLATGLNNSRARKVFSCLPPVDVLMRKELDFLNCLENSIETSAGLKLVLGGLTWKNSSKVLHTLENKVSELKP